MQAEQVASVDSKDMGWATWQALSMTLQQVLDFLAIAQHGSLHAAARASDLPLAPLRSLALLGGLLQLALQVHLGANQLRRHLSS